MLRGVTNFVRKLYGDRPLIRDLETWAKDTAKLATPDELVVASVIQAIAKEFNKWALTGSSEPQRDWNASGIIHKYHPAKLKLSNGATTVIFRYSRLFIPEPGYTTIGKHRDSFEGCFINGTRIEGGLKIKEAWEQISAKVKAAEEAAAKAKAEMEANEAKWNLAEKLLGMKRNEFGALVPIETAS